MVNAAIWPALDYSRVPYRLYHDAEIYEREQERIFRGKAWKRAQHPPVRSTRPGQGARDLTAWMFVGDGR